MLIGNSERGENDSFDSHMCIRTAGMTFVFKKNHKNNSREIMKFIVVQFLERISEFCLYADGKWHVGLISSNWSQQEG